MWALPLGRIADWSAPRSMRFPLLVLDERDGVKDPPRNLSAYELDGQKPDVRRNCTLKYPGDPDEDGGAH
jgi:hypothetical protein